MNRLRFPPPASLFRFAQSLFGKALGVQDPVATPEIEAAKHPDPDDKGAEGGRLRDFAELRLFELYVVANQLREKRCPRRLFRVGERAGPMRLGVMRVRCICRVICVIR